MSEWERKRERENESNDGRAKARGKKIFQSLTSFSSKRQPEKRKSFFFGFRRNNLGPECWRRRLLRLETDFYLSHRKTNFEPRPEKIGSNRSDRVDKDEKRPNFFPPGSFGRWLNFDPAAEKLVKPVSAAFSSWGGKKDPCDIFFLLLLLWLLFWKPFIYISNGQRL